MHHSSDNENCDSNYKTVITRAMVSGGREWDQGEMERQLAMLSLKYLTMFIQQSAQVCDCLG